MKTCSKFLVKVPKENNIFEEHVIESVSAVCEFLKISNYTFYAIMDGTCKYHLSTTKHLKNYQIIPLEKEITEEIKNIKHTLKQKIIEQKVDKRQLKNEFIQQNIEQFNEFIKNKKGVGLEKKV